MEPATATATAAVADVPVPVPVHAHVHVPAPLESPTTANSSTSPSSEGDPQNQNERQPSLASTSTRPDQSKERITVPSACVQCRSKHLKCDGLNPCTRCSSNSFECIYVRSRRGFKGPRRNGTNGTPNKANAVSGPVDRSCPMINPGAARGASNVPSGLATPPDHRLQTLPRGVDLPLFDIGQELVSFEPKPLPSGLDLRERCIEAFFYHFYPAHPFILPRDAFLKLRKEKPLDALEAAMRYVGSFYVPQAPIVALGHEAERTVYNADCPRDGFRVQAMLILTIGLDGYRYQEKALQILVDAQELALEFGMNKREFAFINGNGSELLEESWRRTWWEMYIVDGMIAGVHQKSTFPMKDIPADVGLPCEERDYVSGVSREACTLKTRMLTSTAGHTLAPLPGGFR
jgi:hypothetical protein